MGRASALPLAIALQYAPASASACAVCFGQADNKALVNGFFWGGVLLLTCTFALLGGLVYAVMRLERARLKLDRTLGLLEP